MKKDSVIADNFFRLPEPVFNGIFLNLGINTFESFLAVSPTKTLGDFFEKNPTQQAELLETFVVARNYKSYKQSSDYAQALEEAERNPNPPHRPH